MVNEADLSPVASKRSCLQVEFLGTAVSYPVAMAKMQQLVTQMQERAQDQEDAYLLFLEHTDVITLTRRHGDQHLLLPLQEIKKKGIEVVETDRGGEATFHGKGQLVGYLIMRLPLVKQAGLFKVNAVGYLHQLENALLHCCEHLGVEKAYCIEGKTGIWVDLPSCRSPSKLIAIGIGLSKGITRHGFAFNIHTELSKFTECMTPCGLKENGVTSLEQTGRERGHPVSLDLPHICQTLAQEIAQTFSFAGIQYKEPFLPGLSSVA